MKQRRYHIRVFSADSIRALYDYQSDDINSICTAFENWYVKRHHSDKLRVLAWTDGEVIFDDTLGVLIKRCLDLSVAF